MSRVPKTDPRLAAYADVDEANTVIGMALTLGGRPDSVTALLSRVPERDSAARRWCRPVHPGDREPGLSPAAG